MGSNFGNQGPSGAREGATPDVLPPGYTITVTFAGGDLNKGWLRPVHAEARDSANGRHIASRQLHDSENGMDAHWSDPRPEGEQDAHPEEWPDWAREALWNLELATQGESTRQDR